ncbi:DEAD-box ATP-dependent DNA helicase Fancm [Onthophagus taurus]|uniref:DEAD-box ATP-dependent DNA helicase Fancm n=1 Tax=Onthophagus taurus TaxID=166361 RepID=UPI0039BDBB61
MDTQLESYHSNDLTTEGFDLHAGKSWIYPTNYPMREYQFRITQEALYKNTLVSLPTGLGKTFIASVVMYNFYRWYPSGKIIFMAPTRPLVKQQIEACYDITGIPQNVTAELTGTKAQISREEIWNTKRVFFITPQVLQNDIDTFPDLCKQIKCIVIDEAHKARGNHAYCEVIRKLHVHSKYFRVLALSATPGNSTNDVIDMSMNLLISHLEVRTEESPDVAPYVFQRHLETVVVPLGGKLEEMRNKYLRVLERYVKVLKDNNIITGNCANLTKGKIFMTLKDFNLRSKYQRHPKHSEISRTLTICITLYHGYELLIRHGMRGFLNFFEEHSKKSLLEGNSQLFAVMDEMQQYIGPRPDISLLPDGTIPQIETNSKFGHPKFYKLRNILLDYFAIDDNKESKVMIFSEFKETVLEAYAMLMQHPPIIRPKYFMGQGAITQKQQITIIKSFKEGTCNVLISTCIGEEGLDIGEVDLIICFDISNKSPIRLIQRMGRTGRKKQGKVIILVTEGKEQELLREALANKTNLSTNVLKSNEIPKHLYKENPKMIPENIFPSCNKMFISVPKTITKKKSGNIKDMFNNITKNETASQILKDVEIIESEEIIPSSVFLWNQSDPLSEDLKLIAYNKPLDILRVYQPVENIKHSNDTDILVSLLQFVDTKRYNLPITQPTVSSQNQNKKRKITKSESNDNFKQTDIRNLFNKPKINSLEVENEMVLEEIKENATKKKIETLTQDLFSEITLFLNICYEEKKLCYFCENTNLCKRLPKEETTNFNPIDLSQLDISSIEALTENDFDAYLQDLRFKTTIQDLNDVDFEQCFDEDIVFDEESIRMETPKKENTFQFEPPKSIKKVIGSINKTSQSCYTENVELIDDGGVEKCCNDNLEVFHLENIDDLFDMNCSEESPVLFDSSLVIATEEGEKREDERSSSPVLGTFTKKTPKKRKVNLKSKLDSASKSSFYVNKSNRIQNEDKSVVENNIEDNIYLGESRNSNLSNYSEDLFDSPINTPKRLNLKSPIKDNKKNFNWDDNFNESLELENELKNEENYYEINSTQQILSKKRKKSQDGVDLNIADLCDESFFGVIPTVKEPNIKKAKIDEKQEEAFFSLTQELKEPKMIEEEAKITQKSLNLDVICDESYFGLTQKLKEPNITEEEAKITQKSLILDDICDESFFGLTQELKEPKINKEEAKNTQKSLNLDDICDESFFGLTQQLKEPKINKEEAKITQHSLNLDDICDESFFGLTQELLKDYKTTLKEPQKESFNSVSQILNKSIQISANENINKESYHVKEKSADSINLNISDICDMSLFDLTQKPKENSPKNIDKSDNVIIIEDSPIKNNSNELLSSDDSLSPVYDYTNNITSQYRRNRSQKNDEIQEERLSPVLTQKFKKPNKFKLKLQNSCVDKDNNLTNPTENKTNNLNSLVNRDSKSNESQSSNTITFDLLDDDNAFENVSYKTPVKSTSRIKLTLKTPRSTKKITKNTISLLNSESEDEKTPKSSKKITGKRISFASSDDEFEEARGWCRKQSPGVSRRRDESNIGTNRGLHKKKLKNPFIDDEAEDTSEEKDSEDFELGSTQDSYDASFVTQTHVLNTTSMHIKYLESVRSPLQLNGRFKIPERPKNPDIDVFSQKENIEDNSYLEDSFCVNISESQLPVEKDLSELEIAERILEENKKLKRNKHKCKDINSNKTKKRRIIVLSDSE